MFVITIIGFGILIFSAVMALFVNITGGRPNGYVKNPERWLRLAKVGMVIGVLSMVITWIPWVPVTIAVVTLGVAAILVILCGGEWS